jgi:hypothetical protein
MKKIHDFSTCKAALLSAFALVLVALAVPGIVSADNTFKTAGSQSGKLKSLTWRYAVNSDGKTATLTQMEHTDTLFYTFGYVVIPETVSDGVHAYSVTAIGKGMMALCSCDSISIPQSVVRIEDRAFANMSSSSQIQGFLRLPKNLTYIGKEAFDGNYFSGDLVIPDGVTEIQDSAFYDAGFNGALTLPANLTYIGAHAFHDDGFNCRLTLPDRLTYIGDYAFYNLSGSLERYTSRYQGDLVIPDKVTYIGANAFEGTAFDGKLSLGAGVTEISRCAFKDCSHLQGGISIPSQVTKIGVRAFQDCSGFNGELTFSLPSSLSTIGELAFSGCSGLTGHLTLPESLVKIGDNPVILGSLDSQFSGTAFESVTLDGAVSYLGNFIPQNSNLRYLDISKASENFEKKVVSRIFSNITTAVIGRTTYIGNDVSPHALIYLPKLDNLTLKPGEVNYVINNVCDSFVCYDENQLLPVSKLTASNHDCPVRHEFTAAKANYDRTFPSSEYCTLYLPYDAVLPEGMMAYVLARESGSADHDFFVFKEMNGNRLHAYTPYLVRSLDGSSHKLAEVDNVTVKVSPDCTANGIQATDDASWQFMGTTAAIDNATAAANGYWILEDNKFKRISTDVPTGHVSPFRCFIAPTDPGKARLTEFSILIEGQTTGIRELEDNDGQMLADPFSGKYDIYSLDGRCLGKDAGKAMSGNIYVVKGRKYLKH